MHPLISTILQKGGELAFKAGAITIRDRRDPRCYCPKCGDWTGPNTEYQYFIPQGAILRCGNGHTWRY